MYPIFYTWWFEPAFATVCFTCFIHWYWYYERNIYHVSVTQSFWSQILHLDVMNGPLLQSFLAYWMGIYIWTRIIPPASNRIPDGIPHNLSECCNLLLEVVLGIVYYDAIFFILHWMMHEIPILRKFHARHHDYHEICRTEKELFDTSNASTNPTDTNKSPPLMMECRQTLCHSFVDGALQVLVNILVQRKVWIPLYFEWKSPLCIGGMTYVVKSRLARMIHNFVVIWMLTESHSAAPKPYIWRQYFIGCREHYLHHTILLKRSTTTAELSPKRIRYQQFFGYLDDLRFIMMDRNLLLSNYSINVQRRKVSA